MSQIVLPNSTLIRQLEVKYGAGVSENTWTKIAGATNHVNLRQEDQHKFTLNGQYGSAVSLPVLALDGIYVFNYDYFITGYTMSNNIGGSSGTTELDCKLSDDNGATWASIFSVTPKIDSTANDFVFFLGYDITENSEGSVFTPNPTPPTGVTIGTFTSAPIAVNKGDGVRVDLIDRMIGAEGISFALTLRPR